MANVEMINAMRTQSFVCRIREALYSFLREKAEERNKRAVVQLPAVVIDQLVGKLGEGLMEAALNMVLPTLDAIQQQYNAVGKAITQEEEDELVRQFVSSMEAQADVQLSGTVSKETLTSWMR